MILYNILYHHIQQYDITQLTFPICHILEVGFYAVPYLQDPGLLEEVDKDSCRSVAPPTSQKHHVPKIHLHDSKHYGYFNHVWVHVRYMYLIFPNLLRSGSDKLALSDAGVAPRDRERRAETRAQPRDVHEAGIGREVARTRTRSERSILSQDALNHPSHS